MGLIHPAVSEICVPQSLDPICGKFDKFLAHGQAHMGRMGKWPWQCTTTGLDNSTELWMEDIRQAVTEIWVPQLWQPLAQPPEPWWHYTSSPKGWGVKTDIFVDIQANGPDFFGADWVMTTKLVILISQFLCLSIISHYILLQGSFWVWTQPL